MREKEQQNEQSLSGEWEKKGAEGGRNRRQRQRKRRGAEGGAGDARTDAAVTYKTRVMLLLTRGTNY